MILAENTLDTARLLFTRIGGVDLTKLSRQKRAILFLFVRGFRAAEATVVLFEEGYGPESFLPARTAFEHLVDLRYVQRTPRMAKLFWDYLKVLDFQRLQLIEMRSTENKIPLALRKRIIAGYKGVKGRFKRGRNEWAPENICDRANSVGLEKEYEYLFRTCCGYSHTGPTTYQETFVEGEEAIDVQLGPASPKDDRPLTFTISTLIQSCQVVDQVFKLKQVPLLNQLANEFKRISKSERSR